MFRGTLTVERLLNYIDRLPRASHYRHERAHDEELAELQAKYGSVVDQVETDVPFTEWTPEREIMTVATEAILALTATVQAALSDGTMRKPDPLPRPSRAIDKVRARLEVDAYEALIAKVEEARARAASVAAADT